MQEITPDTEDHILAQIAALTEAFDARDWHKMMIASAYLDGFATSKRYAVKNTAARKLA
jgi:hypothetical protein